MTRPTIIERAKSFYDKMKITDKCTFSEVAHWTATYRCDDTRCCIIQF